MFLIERHEERVIEKDLLALALSNPMTLLDLLRVAGVPLKAGTFRKLLAGIRHTGCISLLYTEVKEKDARRGDAQLQWPELPGTVPPEAWMRREGVPGRLGRRGVGGRVLNS